ncbi:MAG: TIGR02221 family CRISPR-associated protein [Deltaproteobacteria bacterium]|nr:TIGR02221 family CRISPR-associated protein [Deltaproteobacteria bacterium]
MAKLFISFLGTNDYTSCVYTDDDRPSPMGPVRFVQEATLDFYCRDWTNEDRIVIFTTAEAYTSNWLDDGHTDAISKERKQRQGLESCIQKRSLKPSLLTIRIPSGKSEEEIWEIFDVVFKTINHGDEIIFDVTYALRSIPLLAMVVLNYAKVLKGVKIRGIYYGAIEALGTLAYVNSLETEKRLVPVFDLAAFDSLLDWTLAISQFLEAGDARKVYKLASMADNPIREKIMPVADHLKRFAKTMTTCRGLDITASTRELKQSLKNYNDPDQEHTKHFPPLKPLLELVHKRLDVFTEDTLGDGIRAAEWCCDHNLIQQGYTILTEVLITHFVEKTGGDIRDYQTRQAASSKFVKIYPAYENMLKTFRKFKDERNDLDHAGFRSKPHQPEHFEEQLGKWLEEIKKNIESPA